MMNRKEADHAYKTTMYLNYSDCRNIIKLSALQLDNEISLLVNFRIITNVKLTFPVGSLVRLGAEFQQDPNQRTTLYPDFEKFDKDPNQFESYK